MKNSKKAYTLGAFVYIAGTAVLLAIFLLMIAINVGTGASQHIKDNVNGIVLICISFCIVSGIMYCYFYFENKKYILCPSKIVEVFLLLSISLLASFLIGKYVNAAARPVAFLALMAVTLLGRREAIFLNIIFALQMFILDNFSDVTGLNALETSESYNFLVLTFCTGMIGIFITPRIKTRIGSVILAFVLLIPIEVINALLGTVDAEEFEKILNLLLFGALSSFFSVLLYMFMLPIFEVMFSELTIFRLRETCLRAGKAYKKTQKERARHVSPFNDGGADSRSLRAGDRRRFRTCEGGGLLPRRGQA